MSMARPPAQAPILHQAVLARAEPSLIADGRSTRQRLDGAIVLRFRVLVSFGRLLFNGDLEGGEIRGWLQL
jgi:hypothetical protein